jgi:hypothetical protein
MTAPYSIERLKSLASGESFDIPDGWAYYSYSCVNGASVTITNELGESITHKGSGSAFYQHTFGFKSNNFKANGGQVLLKWY